MEFRELLDLSKHYLKEKINGVDYKDIRRELLRKNLSEEDINKVIHRVQRLELQHLKKKNANVEFSSGALIGLIITLIGVGITAYTYFSGAQIYIIAYGAILSGISMMVYNLTRYRK